MNELIHTLDTPALARRLRDILIALPVSEFNLQRALRQGSIALPETLDVAIIRSEPGAARTLIRVSLFFQSVIAGCNCADDPSPEDRLEEHCEARILIENDSGKLQVTLDS